jgi:hypothetical protein
LAVSWWVGCSFTPPTSRASENIAASTIRVMVNLQFLIVVDEWLAGLTWVRLDCF